MVLWETVRLCTPLILLLINTSAATTARVTSGPTAPPPELPRPQTTTQRPTDPVRDPPLADDSSSQFSPASLAPAPPPLQTPTIRTTSGHSGALCIGPRRCLYREASCVSDQCVCRHGQEGRGDFQCHPPGYLHTEVLNDPLLNMLNGEKVQIPLPCRYLLTHVRTLFTGWPSSTCEMQVHVIQRKERGKIFVAGVDIAVRITTPITPAGYGEISFRKFGHAIDGIYTYEELGVLRYAPDGPFESTGRPVSTYMPGSYITMRHDPYNNIAFLEVEPCGFKATLRLYDITKGKDQAMVPGASVSVNPKHNPEFLSVNRALSFPPNQSESLESLSRELGLTPAQAIIYRTLTSDVEQTQPDFAASCQTLHHVLRPCRHIRRAMDKCMFLLSRPLVISCLDESKNGEKILNIFGKCVQAVCDASAIRCEGVKKKLKKCDQSKRPEVGHFIQSNCHIHD